MRNLFVYPPAPLRGVFDQSILYQAVRYYYFSRQVTPNWSSYAISTKIDHFIRIYRLFRKGR